MTGQNQNVHISPSGDGSWSVRKTGAVKSSTVVSTQKEAIQAARDLARPFGGEIYVHGSDGAIRSRDTVRGADPCPAKR